MRRPSTRLPEARRRLRPDVRPLGLEWYRVKADVGVMGGHGADEYMAPCPAGENEVALAAGYAANLEVAPAQILSRSHCRRRAARRSASRRRERRRWTPSSASSACRWARCSRRFRSSSTAGTCNWWSSGAITGSTRSSCRTRWAGRSAPPTPRRSLSGLGPPGYIGPVGAQVPVLLDEAVRSNGAGAYVAGANEADAHLTGVVPGRDFPFEDGRRPHRRRRRHRQRQRDPDRAGDRDRQHLQARHPLLRAAGCHTTWTSTASRS